MTRYYTKPLFEYLIFNVDVNVKQDAFDGRVLSSGSAAALLAAWHVGMHRPAEARTAIDEAKKSDPKVAASFDAEGMLLDSEHKRRSGPPSSSNPPTPMCTIDGRRSAGIRTQTSRRRRASIRSSTRRRCSTIDSRRRSR